jgi:hypothetical protein
MAIGDAVQQRMGTATTARQPSSGVEELITFVHKLATNDAQSVYDGSVVVEYITGAAYMHDDAVGAAQRFGGDYNLKMTINNSVYTRKEGTSDINTIQGVQTAT